MSNLPPSIHVVDTLLLPAYQTIRLANGMELYSLYGGSEPVLRLEIVFRAGACFEAKTGIAECMAALMAEGTMDIPSAELAEKIEAYGATLQTRGGVDTVRIRLYTLTRFFPDLIEIIKQVVTRPAFDEKELEVYINNKIERLQIDLKKNEVLAYRHLTEAIYGVEHPYGRNAFPMDFLAITPSDLRSHHERYILPETGMIFLSGSFGEAEIDLIHSEFGSWNPVKPNGTLQPQTYQVISESGYQEIDGPQTHQAAVRIGRKLFTQHHPDFNGLFVLNTILGGYFGSRLMTEVRENLGLTYGIYSGIDSFAEDGCFYISTETTTQNIQKVIQAIQDEVQKLQTILMEEDELQMAKNYLMGHLMTQVDGPFATLDYIKTMKIERLPDPSFARTVSTIQEITTEKLMELARQYMDLETWSTIVVR